MTDDSAPRDSGNVVPFPRKQQRLNININQQTRDALMEVAARDDVSITEAVRRLVPIGAFVWRAIREGYELQLVKDGETERVVFGV